MSRIAPRGPSHPVRAVRAGLSMPLTEDNNRRLEELEVRVAFQEDLLATLNRDVAEASRELADLRQLIARLRGELELIRNALAPDPRGEPPPPHY